MPHASHANVTVTLADIVGRFGDDLRRQRRLPRQAHRVLNAIASCRTEALGGQRYDCSRCGHRHFVYHSCRNRHCPQCQSFTKAQWLAARQAELLPVPYFHLVFTLPHELNPALMHHRRSVLNLLFTATAQTLLQFGRQNLGGRVGFTMVLHTWDQQMNLHPHVHVLIPAGALAGDGNRWIAAKRSFLFPVHALSKVFRGKFMHQAKAWIDDPAVLDRLYTKPWVVYAKKPFAGPRKLLNYLGRYTHRVAISNHRLGAIHGDRVVFDFRNRRRGDVVQTMNLDGVEFLRRFLLHVLPHRLQRIRHYGLLANRCKAALLARCRQLLSAPSPEVAPFTLESWLTQVMGRDIRCCPQCKARTLVATAVPARSSRAPPPSSTRHHR